MRKREVFAPVSPGQAPLVLFICRYNAGPSQIAEAYLRKTLGSAVVVKSVGTTPQRMIDAHIASSLEADGVCISQAFPKLVMPSDIDSAHYIVTIGSGIHGIRESHEHWACDSTAHQSLQRVLQIRNILRAHVALLSRRLSDHLPNLQKVAG